MPTADISFNIHGKGILSSCHNPIIRMASTLVEWRVDCSKKNVVLNGKIVRVKSLSLFKVFTDTAINEKLC